MASHPGIPAQPFPYAEILDELRESLSRVDVRQFLALADEIASASSIFLAGVGRSGLVARMFAVRLTHLGRRVHVMGESTSPACGSGDLLIIVSGSGKTRGLRHLPASARSVKTRVAVVTSRRNSPLGRRADLTVLVPVVAGRGGAQAPLSRQFGASLFEQGALICLETLVLVLMRRLRETEPRMTSRHQNLE